MEVLNKDDLTSAALVRSRSLEGLYQRGNLLFVALGDVFNSNAKAGLAIVDVREPTSPSVLPGAWVSGVANGGSGDVVADHTYAYLGNMENGVVVIRHYNGQHPMEQVGEQPFLPSVDFPNPNPTPGGATFPQARGLALDEATSTLYVAFYAGGVRVLDVSDPEHLDESAEIGRYINVTCLEYQQAYNNIVLNGNIAYVAVDYCGMEILDISDPTAPTRISWWNPWDCQTSPGPWFWPPCFGNPWLCSSGHEPN